MNVATTCTRVALVSALALACSDARAADWDWVVAPYLWIASIDTDFHSDTPPFDSQREFDGVLEDLSGTFQLHVEGQGDRFGLMADVLYLGLEDEIERPTFDADSSLDATVFDAAFIWNVEPQRYEGFDAIFGLRYISLDFGVDFDPVNPALPNVGGSIDRSFTDVLIGGRYTAALNERWKLVSRLDGSFGDTEGTFNASMMLAWQTESLGSWSFGYRYMHGELGDDGRSVDVTLHGPVVAYAFGFR